MINEKERIDDLQCRGYRIIQSPDGYCFTGDSVLLSNLASVKKNDRVVDLCTGSGVIALLINAKYSPSEVVGVELQPRLADMAVRSVELNDAKNVKIVNAPLQGVHKIIGSGYDAVTVNPPYGKICEKEEYTEEDICKYEVSVTLEEIIKESSLLLRYGGSFYMINKAGRLIDTVCLMRKYGIEPKKINFVQPKINKDADTFVVEGKRGGKSFVTVPPTIIVYKENGEYTDEVRSLYNK